MTHLPQLRIPATYMRGGTSKGVFFRLQDLPGAAQSPGPARDALLMRVIGSPDPERGEVVKAYVVAAPGAAPGAELARELQAFVRERLAAYEYPRAVAFVEELPMTVTGKIRRGELRRLDRSTA